MRFQNSMNREVIHKMKKTEIRRGDIFSYDFGTRIGSIQSGVRPVLVIQADNFNANAPTVIVASITSVIKKRYLPSHIILGEDFGLTKPSMVLLEQIQTVNKDDLTEYIGFVDDEDLLGLVGVDVLAVGDRSLPEFKPQDVALPSGIERQLRGVCQFAAVVVGVDHRRGRRAAVVARARAERAFAEEGQPPAETPVDLKRPAVVTVEERLGFVLLRIAVLA